LYKDHQNSVGLVRGKGEGSKPKIGITMGGKGKKKLDPKFRNAAILIGVGTG